jgi:RNA polymerase sigma factor (sigma-70 family)
MTKSSEINDKILWTNFKEGDKPSFEKIFNHFYPMLINYGHKFTHNNYIIEESVQDLFIKLWRNKLNLGDPPIVKLYLFKAFRTIIFRKLKKTASHLTEDIDDEHYNFSFVLAPDQKLIDDEKTEEVRKTIQVALSILTARQREAVYLRFYEGMSYEQIAEMLQMNIGGTYKLIYRALERLKENLGEMLFSAFMAAIVAKSISLS